MATAADVRRALTDGRLTADYVSFRNDYMGGECTTVLLPPMKVDDAAIAQMLEHSSGPFFGESAFYAQDSGRQKTDGADVVRVSTAVVADGPIVRPFLNVEVILPDRKPGRIVYPFKLGLPEKTPNGFDVRYSAVAPGSL